MASGTGEPDASNRLEGLPALDKANGSGGPFLI